MTRVSLYSTFESPITFNTHTDMSLMRVVISSPRCELRTAKIARLSIALTTVLQLAALGVYWSLGIHFS